MPRNSYRFTKYVEFRRRNEAVDDFTAISDLTVLLFTAWADVRQMPVAETVEARQTYDGSRYQIVIRYPRIRVAPDDYVLLNEDRLDIESVTDLDGDGRFLTIFARSRTGAAGGVNTNK